MKKLVGMFALAAATAAAPVHAQSVNFVGTTLGCFYTTVVCAPAATSALTGGSLSFQGGSFNVTTSNGFVGVGNNAMATNNFGTFMLPATVSAQTLPATGTNFLLHILFTTPTGVSPNPVPFMATVTGSVTADAGGYFINFNNDPRNITWTGGNGTVWVNDVSIVNSVAATATAITGNITANQTAVPEPSTLLLVASGIAGLAATARRRQSNV
jgi:hypothetical protein